MPVALWIAGLSGNKGKSLGIRQTDPLDSLPAFLASLDLGALLRRPVRVSMPAKEFGPAKRP